ncbi:MAG TPA: DUF397 domain-containing protein [Kineosporiaceae bacterium]|nr:DUF397 domain-containing protein [Kineosporiaceae bacterium]
MGDNFRKSSFSGPTGCVEVLFLRNGVRVRDSKDPSGPELFFTNHEWETFLKGVAAGEFEIPHAAPVLAMQDPPRRAWAALRSSARWQDK